MFESLGTDPTWLGIGTASAIISLAYVGLQLLRFLWKKRIVLTRGLSAFRLQRSLADLHDLDAAVSRKEHGYSDFALAIPSMIKVVKAFISLAVGFIFLILISITASVVPERPEVFLAAMIAVFCNVLVDLGKFAGKVQKVLWIVAAANAPESYRQRLNEKIDHLQETMG